MHVSKENVPQLVLFPSTLHQNFDRLYVSSQNKGLLRNITHTDGTENHGRVVCTSQDCIATMSVDTLQVTNDHICRAPPGKVHSFIHT